MNINLGSANKDKNSFDFSHDVITTSNFGFWQPTLCRELIPNSKFDLKQETFVRLSNMVAPSFGQIKVKNSFAFVPFRLVYPNHTQLLQGQQVNGSAGAFIPTKIPSFNYVAFWIGFVFSRGGKFTIYDSDHEQIYRDNVVINLKGHGITQLTTASYDTEKSIEQHKYVFPLFFDGGEYDNVIRNISNSPVFNLVTDDHAELDGCFIGFTPTVGGQAEINLLSKIFIGLGYTLPEFFGSNLNKGMLEDDFDGINTTSYVSCNKSVLPLLAYSRYYYEHLAPLRERTFQDTPTYKFIEIFRDCDGVRVDQADLDHNYLYPSYEELLSEVIRDMFTFYYTLPPDIFTQSLSSVNNDSSTISVRTGDGPNTTSDIETVAGHVPTNLPNGSRLEATVIQGLLKALKYANRNTLVGRNVTKWLESRFGVVSQNEYTNQCHHLGINNTDVSISDIYATANSDGEFGNTLGSYSGRGLGYDEGDGIDFSVKEFGYVIALQTVVPITHYYQGVKAHVDRLTRFDFFTSEFENLGYEAIPRECVNVSVLNGRNVFGFIPRYANYKYQLSTVNGDFANGYKDMDAYHLMRTLPNKVLVLNETFRKLSQDLVSGADKSYLRIFANTQLDLDHFLLYNRMHFKVSQPMTRISDSYDVEDYGNGNVKVDYT